MISPSFNIGLVIGQRGLHRAEQIIHQAAERLATGSRINRASDDPSGMIVVEELDAQLRTIEAKLAGLDQEEARLGATEGALSVVADMMHELQGLVITAANKGGLSPEELDALQLDADSLIRGMDMIANTTVFKGEKLFDGLFSSRFGFMYDPDGEEGEAEAQRITLASLQSGGLLNLVDGDAEGAQDAVEAALDGISNWRATIGARIKEGIGSERRALFAELENTTQARSLIADADVATEMSNLIRGQILQQASISAMLVGRSAPQQALSLLSANVSIAQNK